MQLLPVFCALFLCGVGYAEDTAFDDAIQNYLASCKRSMEEKGNLMMAYVYTNPHTFGRIPSFDIASFKADFDPMNEKSKSEVLLKTACVCTKVPMNTYDYIVVPFMFNGTIRDALTMCLFHDDYTEYDYVLNFPDHLLSNWMYAQYIAQMPKTLIAPANKALSANCIDLSGNPTAQIPNQKACYYFNYAAFEEIDGKIDTVAKNSYNGPFLGSQYPDFAMLRDLAESETPAWDFMAQFDFVLCSLIKTRSWLSPDDYKTGCRHRVFNNAKKVVIYGCCCNGHADPNCNEVTEAVKENSTLCLEGELSGGSTNFYFAPECPYTAVKKYFRQVLFNKDGNDDSFEHLKALEITADPTINCDKSLGCNPSYATECHKNSVDVVHKGCCSDTDFCNLKDAMSSNIKRCTYTYGENQEINGCAVIFYRANNQWYRSSPVWFDMEKSELIHLYSSQVWNVAYTVSLGFLVDKSVDLSCPEQSHQYERQYYVISCAPRFCDYAFGSVFFSTLDENVINTAISNAPGPRCENGSMTVVTNSTDIDQFPLSADTTRIFGVYCVLNLQISHVRDKTTVHVSFGPKFPKPDDCTTDKKMIGDKYTCCYKASTNVSHIEPRCHYSTIMSVVMAQVNDSAADNETTTLNPDELVNHQNSQGVYENADKCEQSNIGHVGKVSRRCYPGGHGCFHLNGLKDANANVIASCIGRAESYVAARKDAFDRYHEALICLTEEAKDKCHLVQSGKRMRYLCCCSSTETRNDLARCKTDSNMMFNTFEYDVKYVGEFKDEY